MAQNYYYPPSGSNASVGTTGVTAPAQATEIAGVGPGGILTPVTIDASGGLVVSVPGVTPGAPFAVDLEQIVGASPSATNSVPSQLTDGTSFYDARQTRALTSADVVTADQGGTWNITNVTGTVSLPTGAATESTLSTFSSKSASNFVTTAFDYTTYTYVPSGPGVGQIQTVVYKTGGAGGSTVATLTFTYDGSNNLSSVTKS